MLCFAQLEVPSVIPKVTSGEDQPFVVTRSAEETNEFFLKIYQPGPQPLLPSAPKDAVAVKDVAITKTFKMVKDFIKSP